jgi:hypothetical protein
MATTKAWKPKKFKTAQAFTDWTFKQLVKQGTRCVTRVAHDTVCAYSNQHGQHCAIGLHLNPNDIQVMQWFGEVNRLIHTFPEETKHLSELPFYTPAFMLAVQRLHDASSPIDVKHASHKLKFFHGIDVSKPQYLAWAEIIKNQ